MLEAHAGTNGGVFDSFVVGVGDICSVVYHEHYSESIGVNSTRHGSVDTLESSLALVILPCSTEETLWNC